MKYSEAWANVAKQNVNLKVAALCLSVCTLFLAFAVVKLSLAEPLIIERSCYSKPIGRADSATSLNEIKTFAALALKQRFESATLPIEGFLSVSELKSRENEQAILAEKDLKQFLIVREVISNENEVLAKVDRIYSVKTVRSGFPSEFKLKLESKPRTETNPYGLILVKTEELKNNEKERGNE